ncbi:MAG: glycosyl hydrolase [Prolixibacteraceae bacterium]|jgi:mannan endo-1,4-beta-mannosidase|nr:glycosyl hydrolase [Prolixibacteraceae bacterium]
MKTFVFLFLLLIALSTSMCKSNNKSTQKNSLRNDATENLFSNLKKMATEGEIMYGCANPTTLMYKETHIYDGFNNSDCKEITGQNPAYYESDFMWFEKDSLKVADIKAMTAAYNRGAVTGYCWHFRGKESNSFYSKNKDGFTKDKNLLKKIVAGGDRSENPELDWFYTQLDEIVISTIKDLGFPLTFRPWHEMNGSWFWWGSESCTPEEYIKLFQMTVDYMRKQGVRNVLYVWSPDTKFAMEYYPGDEYVDILGIDMYEMGAIHYKPMEMCIEELEKLTDYAAEHGKVAAITETGLRMQDNKYRYPEEIHNYWSKYILEPIVSNPKLNRLVWVESWYSADWSKHHKSQFYYPYIGIEKDFEKGQSAIDDFMKFYNHPSTLFENNLPNMYTRNE